MFGSNTVGRQEYMSLGGLSKGISQTYRHIGIECTQELCRVGTRYAICKNARQISERLTTIHIPTIFRMKLIPLIMMFLHKWSTAWLETGIFAFH